MTLTGILFSLKIFTVSSRFFMVAVLGSSIRLVCSDKDVIEIFTLINWSFCNVFKRSKSLKTKAFLVIIETGCLYFKNSSKHFLVISNCFSAGW